MNDYTKKIFKKDGALVAKEKRESQLRNANIFRQIFIADLDKYQFFQHSSQMMI